MALTKRISTKSVQEAPKEAVPSYEQEQISRGLLAWLNQYQYFPAGIRRFDFEFLEDDRPCMALSTIQGTYITKRYVGGDYMAEYKFKLIYRGQPTTNGDRLKMDEELDAIGDSAVHRFRWYEKPDIGTKKLAQRLTINARSSLFGRYENGDEDHQILMTMTYYSERS